MEKKEKKLDENKSIRKKTRALLWNVRARLRGQAFKQFVYLSLTAEECENCKNPHVNVVVKQQHACSGCTQSVEMMRKFVSFLLILIGTSLHRHQELTSSSINVPTGRPLISKILSPTWMAFRTSGLISIPLTLEQNKNIKVSAGSGLSQ